MENETNQPVRTKIISKRQRLANILNPLKTGKTSKYFNVETTEFLKNPHMLGDIIIDSIKKLEEDTLTAKERLMYISTLTNIYKTIYGNKNLNVNVEVSPDQMNKQIVEIITNMRDGTGK